MTKITPDAPCRLCGGTLGSGRDGAHNLCLALDGLGLPTPCLGHPCTECRGSGSTTRLLPGQQMPVVFGESPADHERRADYLFPTCSRCGGAGTEPGTAGQAGAAMPAEQAEYEEMLEAGTARHDDLMETDAGYRQWHQALEAATDDDDPPFDDDPAYLEHLALMDAEGGDWRDPMGDHPGTPRYESTLQRMQRTYGVG